MRPERKLVERIIILLVACLALTGIAAPTLALDARRAGVWSAAPALDSRPALSAARIVSFGLYGPESVFESEARGAAAVLRQWLGAEAQPTVAVNGKRRASATVSTLAASLRRAGRA